jgi:hypothetical protein
MSLSRGRRINAGLGFRSFAAADRIIQPYEAMHMIHNGQVRWLAKGILPNKFASSDTSSDSQPDHYIPAFKPRIASCLRPYLQQSRGGHIVMLSRVIADALAGS